MPLGLAQSLVNTEGVSMYTVSLRDRSGASIFARALSDAAHAAGLQIRALPWKEHALGDAWRRTMSLLGVFRTFILAVVIAIVGLSVLSTIAKSIHERRREIATLRSLGAMKTHVVSLLVLEALVMSSAAALLGLLSSAIVARHVNGLELAYDGGILAEPVPLVIALNARGCGFAAALLIAVSVIATLVPARRAANANPVAGLADA
jgi:putative ABC transport system permease protein